MSVLGDKVRELYYTSDQTEHDIVATEVDRAVDLLDRERDTQQHTMRANLDLIKRLKDANDKLEAIRAFVRDQPGNAYDVAYDEIRDILDDQPRTSDEVLADLRKRLAGD